MLNLNSSDTYQIPIEEIFDGVLIGSNEERILDVNNIFCKICGRTKASLLGEDIGSTLFTKRSIYKTPLQFDLLLKGETVINEREIIHKNGSILPVEMRTKMLPNGTFYSFFCDISGKKTSEDTIQNEMELLSQFNKNKDIFITSLAHDLRSPFHSILGFLDLLSANIRTYDINTIEKYVHIIKKMSLNNFNLLEDTLSWAKSSSNRFKFEPQTVGFSIICDEVFNHFQFVASQKNISIQHSISKDLNVFADKNMIKVVLRNLISNAIKFTYPGGQIKISAKKNDRDVIITVSDNGIGIKPEIVRELFDFTKKITTTGTDNENGTGLGLILCKEFVEIHHGKIWLESEVNTGTDLKFALPNK